MSGTLDIILGPMYAGKSTKLINIYRKNSSLMKRICVVNYSEDNRYSTDSLCTHDGDKIPSVKLDSLSVLKNNDYLQNFDMFIIDEGQFYLDLVEVCNFLVNSDKDIVVAGLSSDFQMKQFGQLINLLPFRNKVEKISTHCRFCSNRAYFTKRLTKETDQKIIGNNIYAPVCRLCHAREFTDEEIDTSYFF